MKNFWISFLVFLITSGCENKIDRTDIFKVGEAIHKSFTQKDTSILNQIHKTKSDLVGIERLKLFYTKDVKFLKVDTTSESTTKYIDLFIEKQGVYCLRSLYYKDSIGQFLVKGFYLTNIDDECKRYLEKPYCPDDKIIIDYFNYDLSDNKKLFLQGSVRLKNNTGSDITYLKFRFKIISYSVGTWEGGALFNQTVKYTKIIYKGDIVNVEIPGLENYPLPFIFDPNEIIPITQIIEVEPKPASYWCKKLEELKNQK